jgi:hypothetical protein
LLCLFPTASSAGSLIYSSTFTVTKPYKKRVQLRGKGDQDGADTWLQIAIEISAMASVATGATDLKTSELLPPSQPAHDIELPREMPRKRRHQSR